MLNNTIKKHPYYSAITVGILLYGLLGFFLAPYLLEKNLLERVQQEFNADLRIENIEVNPFALSLKISGLELDSPEGDPTVRIQQAFTNFQLSSIFRLAFTFDEIRFTSAELFVARDESGKMNFAYLLASADAEKSSEDSSLLHALIYKFAIEDLVINWSDQVPVEPIKTRFGPIDINIKDLNTLPNRSAQQTVTIATENAGTLSWAGSLQLNPFKSSGHLQLTESYFPLVSAYIRHQSGIEIVDGSAGFEADYEVNQTESGEIEARINNINLALADIRINSFADGTGFDFSGPDQEFLKLPNIQLSNGEFRWPEQTVSLQSIAIDQPKISISRDEKGVFSLEPRQFDTSNHNSGSAANAVVSPDDDSGATITSTNTTNSGAIPWQFSLGNLAVNGLTLDIVDQSVTPQATLGIADFNLNISDISNVSNKRFPTTLSMQAVSGGKLSLKGEMSVLPDPQFDFEVILDAIQLAAAQPYLKQQANLNLASGAINLDGHINGSAKEPFSFKGNLEVVDLLLAESINDARLASWKKFRASKIALSLADRQLDISGLHFDQLYGDILIDRNGSLNIAQIKKSDAAEPSVSEVVNAEVVESKTTETTQPDFNIRIGDITLAEASADFADLSLALPFAVKIDSLNGKITTISNQSSEPSEISLEGKVDEFGLARISGFATPLLPAKNTNLLVQFDNIAVPKFTPYSIPFAGYKIASGNLDLKLGYQIKDSQMVGDNSIILRDFELGDKVAHPGALDIPLGLAVALLKDASGKINIDLPISGNVDDPKFNYGEVVKSTLGNLLVKIILSPFALLGNLLGIEASELENINFLDGRSDLTPPQMQRTGKLAEALSLRPELQLVINGVSDAIADGLALRTIRFDKILQARISKLATSSDPTIQSADQKRKVLELLFEEQSATSDAPQKLAALRIQFTTLVAVEGQTPAETFDRLAYTSELRRQLIDLQPIDENDMSQLATARAEALKAALITIDKDLQQRILIGENTTVTRKDGESIAMKVTLSTDSNPGTKI